MVVIIKTSPPITVSTAFVQASGMLRDMFDSLGTIEATDEAIEIEPLAQAEHCDIALLNEFAELDESERNDWFARNFAGELDESTYLVSHLFGHVADIYHFEKFLEVAAEWIAINLVCNDAYMNSIRELFTDTEVISDEERARLRHENRWIFYEDWKIFFLVFYFYFFFFQKKKKKSKKVKNKNWNYNVLTLHNNMTVIIKTSPKIAVSEAFVQASGMLRDMFESVGTSSSSDSEVIEIEPLAGCTHDDLALMNEFAGLDESERDDWFARNFAQHDASKLDEKIYLVSHLYGHVSDIYNIEAFQAAAATWIAKNIVERDEYADHIREIFSDTEEITEAERAELREKNKWIFYE